MSKFKFALDTGDSLNITGVNYKGEGAIPYVAPAVLSAETITNNLCRVMPDVKFKANLQKLSGVSVQTAACDFSIGSANAVTLTDVVLEPTDLKVNYEICKADLRQTWGAAQTGSHLGSQLPPDFSTFLLQYTAAKVGENVERNIWQGSYDANGTSAGSALVSNFTGFCKRLVDGNAAVGYEKNPTAAFVADAGTNGVLKHLDDLVSNSPSVIQNSSNTVIYMSRATLFLLHRATSTMNAGQILIGGTDRPTSWLGFPIVTPAGFPNDTLIMGEPENFVFGTNALTDHTSVDLVDMSKTDASDNVRVAMRFSGGTQIVDLGDVGFVSRAS
jgi:hypothetical protein